MVESVTVGDVDAAGRAVLQKLALIQGEAKEDKVWYGPRLTPVQVLLLPQRANLGNEFSNHIGRQSSDPLASKELFESGR
ncbi:hypothetical protein OG453_42315 [Streptomyces sp. NBC_01381]|uniref:hypothetical protein n=1 Tax=Streptomyces sp. NBC_01381 TaxID=2903845 RepID=UPI00224FA685|nr:hypothetical protein [Streptomyces sp. NBC_01381]MCX4673197.1 hypothetical protein [Streptomyces sp. NBC_01381]